MIQSGNTTINPEAWKDKTKVEFFEAIKGKVSHDKEDLWNQVLKANESTSEPSKQDKKPYNKRASASTESE